jgi:hypothetical protein
MDHSNLRGRAAEISATALSLSDTLAKLGQPEPSFELGLSDVLKSDTVQSEAGVARQKLLQILDDFRSLLTEPTLLLTPELVSFVQSRSQETTEMLLAFPLRHFAFDCAPGNC